ncbi:MAG: anhydro-N-acetylmuramic acid kinase [Planctomycetes bacterium]|nr:anhydro-N-acetylmuramic acid kinase [Planctomycetota bacterium]
MNPRYFIGLSSGSSLLGVDAALVRVDSVGRKARFSLEQFRHAPFGNELRELLWQVTTNPTPELRHLGTLHRVLGETFAMAVNQLLTSAREQARDVLCIGCPGLLLWHDGNGRYPATRELGMMAVLAERTGLTVLSDFWSRDLALGGHGLPIHALVDAMLFHEPTEHRVRLHLGATASLVSLPGQLGPKDQNIQGWQAAPCTLLLDGLMRLLTHGRDPFDAGGKHAVQGRCLEPLLKRWMQNHFFQERPPKSVPRHEFGVDFLNRAIDQAKRQDGNLHDVLCTMTHFVAGAIAHSITNYLPTAPARILVSGGGVRNGLLWHLLEQKLTPVLLERTDAHGIPAEICKALAHAGLAALTLDGVPGNLPSVTGAAGQRLVGQITPGAPANWARCLTWMARQAAPHHAVAA